MRLLCTARPAGHLNAGSVREADQRSQLKCLCSEVICHWRGFPLLGVGLTAVEGKDRLSVVYLTPCAPVLFTCLLFFCEKDGMFLKALSEGIMLCEWGQIKSTLCCELCTIYVVHTSWDRTACRDITQWDPVCAASVR